MLSGIELYYALPENVQKSAIVLDGQEAYHATKVMRNQIGDSLFVTNGLGSIFETEIIEIKKRSLLLKIIDKTDFNQKFMNIVFCIPRLKLGDRFEFAIEKSIELGITNIIVFDSERSIAKGEKLERWNKIAISAMKQSLHSFLPNIQFRKNVKALAEDEGIKYIFDQNSNQKISDIKPAITENLDEKHYFVFGPEGGFSERENGFFINPVQLQLTENRLRSETAIVTAAAMLRV